MATGSALPSIRDGFGLGLAPRATIGLASLALCGAGIVASTLVLARLAAVPAHPRAFVAWLVATTALFAVAILLITVIRPPAHGALPIIFVITLAVRVAFALQTPTASSDIYRYVWDGHVQAHAINPYRYPPDSAHLMALRDLSIYPHINRQSAPTICPPVAEGLFSWIYRLHADSVIWTKLAFAGLDIANIALLAGLLAKLGRRPELAVLYAWHPFAIFEVGHDGHVDVAAVLFLLLALWSRQAGRAAPARALIAAAALVKYYAILALLALVFRDIRRNGRLGLGGLGMVVLAYLPFVSVGPRVFGYLPG